MADFNPNTPSSSPADPFLRKTSPSFSYFFSGEEKNILANFHKAGLYGSVVSFYYNRNEEVVPPSWGCCYPFSSTFGLNGVQLRELSSLVLYQAGCEQEVTPPRLETMDRLIVDHLPTVHEGFSYLLARNRRQFLLYLVGTGTAAVVGWVIRLGIRALGASP